MSPHHPNHSMVAILIMTCCDLENDVHIIKHLSFPNDIHANLEAFHPLVPVRYTDTKQTSHFLLKFGNYVPL